MTTQLIKVEAVQELVLSAPAALQKNNTIMLAGVKMADDLLSKIESTGMNDELDQACNDWQVKAKKGLSLMDEARKPITQMLTAITKKFTELEAPLDQKKADSKYSAIQEHRNLYAKKKAIEEQKRQEEIQKKQRHEIELNNLKAYFNQQIIDAEIQLRYHRKGYMSKILETSTLADIHEVNQKVANLPLALQISKYNDLEISTPTLFLVTKEEAKALILQIKSDKYNEVAQIHKEELEAFRTDTIDSIPAKRMELQEMDNAKNDALKTLAIQKQQQERKDSEDAKFKKEAEDARLKAEQDASTQNEIENANTMFNAANELAEGTSNSTTSVRQGYKIVVLSVFGFQQIAAFWFQKEGLALSIDTIDKKSLGQMKAFCEKHAHKTNEKIESSALRYEDDFKAIATKG